MSRFLRMAAPRSVAVIDQPSVPLEAGQARVRTIYSGISAGTELTAYRGTNPYLTSIWDPDARLFQPGQEALGYPLDGWGYSEVGEVEELAPQAGQAVDTVDADPPVQVGDMVWGIWGHRDEGVLAAESLRGHVLPEGMDPLAGAFVRVGAIALSAVLAADLGPGSTVAIFGQGVIGLLATRFAVLNGAKVIAVDGIQARRRRALEWGALHALGPAPELAGDIRRITGGAGVDVAIELSGNYRALHEATRAVGADGTVIAAGFYQGEAAGVRFGEEFHHNRVQLLASQIGSVPNRLRSRWTVPRLQQTVVDHLADGRVNAPALVTHTFSLANSAKAYELLDTDPESALQVVLEFP
ncbi:oxidoreductase [Pseudarthrobacter sulfonivorans]|uniref:Oxidoreductase n=1 Tax=Pseudarthrobacter sulfonivorans TaxID=121292 RepID=A0A0U3Q8V0_9MICC|nr:zinc-binding alcohol dehydrogenase [Pseudarthrobacter sulfonivorans]ALV40717.1 oxidoreductase [Pseudarthrobacter sulfonivorans]